MMFFEQNFRAYQIFVSALKDVSTDFDYRLFALEILRAKVNQDLSK